MILSLFQFSVESELHLNFGKICNVKKGGSRGPFFIDIFLS